MKSTKAKVLHEVAGEPLLGHVLRALHEAGVDDVVVVVGHQREKVAEYLHTVAPTARTAVQPEMRGTGDAVRQAMPAVRPGRRHDHGPGRRHPAAQGQHAAGTGRRPCRVRCRRHRAHRAAARPDRVRPDRARRGRGAAHRRAQGRQRGGVGDRRDQQRLVPVRGCGAARRAGAPDQPQRPGRGVPHRRHRLARRGRPVGQRTSDRGRRRDPRHQRPRATGRRRSRAAGAYGAALDARGRDDRGPGHHLDRGRCPDRARRGHPPQYPPGRCHPGGHRGGRSVRTAR